MGLTYGNGVVNIFASAARDGNHPFLVKRPVGPNIPYEVSVDGRREGGLVCFKPVSDLNTNPYIDGHLIERGWIMQERLLSRRTIFFGKNWLLWECKGTIRNEYHPDTEYTSGKITEAYDAFRVSQKHNTEFSQLTSQTPPLNDVEACYDLWRRIIEGYADTDLTYDTDRLPALSGPAQQLFHTRLNHDTYLAGIWKGDVINGLTWASGSKTPYPNSPDSGPSWSWSTFPRRVYHPDYTVLDPQINLLDTEIVVSSSNPFGKVHSGRLTISGVIVQGTTYRDASISPDHQLVRVLHPHDDDNEENKTCLFHPNPKNCRYHACDSDSIRDLPEHVYLLLITAYKELHGQTSGLMVRYLVLEPVDQMDSGGPKTYRRIGYQGSPYSSDRWKSLPRETFHLV